MRFSKAHERLLDGKKIRRSIWASYWQLVVLHTYDGVEIATKLLSFHEGRVIGEVAINNEDMLADDWQVIEEDNK
jgi:hypothetical protein